MTKKLHCLRNRLSNSEAKIEVSFLNFGDYCYYFRQTIAQDHEIILKSGCHLRLRKEIVAIVLFKRLFSSGNNCVRILCHYPPFPILHSIFDLM